MELETTALNVRLAFCLRTPELSKVHIRTLCRAKTFREQAKAVSSDSFSAAKFERLYIDSTISRSPSVPNLTAVQTTVSRSRMVIHPPFSGVPFMNSRRARLTQAGSSYSQASLMITGRWVMLPEELVKSEDITRLNWRSSRRRI